MMKTITKLFVGMIVLASSSGVFAFDINPIDEHCWGQNRACKLTRASDRFYFPVHETMTVLAYDCSETPDDCHGYDTGRPVRRPPGMVRSIIIGSEWNDDPDYLIRRKVMGAAQYWCLYKDAEKWADCNKHSGPGCRIVQDPMMLYRTLFGDLQFLHAMASTDNEIADETKKKIMAWAKFTYNIYVSKEKGNLAKRTISSFNPEISNIIGKDYTIGALFDPARVGRMPFTVPGRCGHYEPSGRPRAYNHSAETDVKDIALGSLLHMVQDSYSESHVYRELGCNIAMSTKEKIILFRNYGSQNPGHHREADRLPDWIDRYKELKTDNPVWASAHLIQYASHDIPWETVHDFLDKKVFPLTDPQARPEPGNDNCWTPP